MTPCYPGYTTHPAEYSTEYPAGSKKPVTGLEFTCSTLFRGWGRTMSLLIYLPSYRSSCLYIRLLQHPPCSGEDREDVCNINVNVDINAHHKWYYHHHFAQGTPLFLAK